MTRRPRVAAAVLGAVVLAGCGSASEPSPPSGVDQLVIPTPSLDPADFVDRIDNPWLPLAEGNEWRYVSADGARSVTVTVLDRGRDIQGVAATAVRTTTADRGRAGTAQTVEYYAQDVEGNVWRLGESGRWEAGVGGAEAGLAMPARPRVGDGFRTEYAAGVAEDQVLVLGLDGSVTAPYDDLRGLLELEVSSPLEPGVVELRLHARGVGLVQSRTVAGGDEVLDLVAFSDDHAG